jgi:two-component system, OmpR family, phosphate regulon sensor histidine kinase PhoR
LKNRLRISLVLMLVSMVLLAAFQGWWLYKSYREEEETLDIRTGILFRETIYQLQVAGLKLDSNVNVRIPSRDAVGVITTLRSKMRDSMLRVTVSDTVRRLPGKFIVSVDGQGQTRRDSSVRAFVRYGPGPNSEGQSKIFDVLLGSESPKDTLRIGAIDSAFKKAMKAQGFDLPFKVTRSAKASLVRTIQADRIGPPPLPRSPDVTLGFLHPVTYKLELGNAFPYILKQMSMQLLFAVFLLTVTILSFLMLYRNLLAQKKLAGIKNDFISNITHELKTPIATVSVAIEALKNFNAMSDPQRTKEYLDISQNELQRLSLLVDKVLKLSMFENKAIDLKPELIDIKSLAEEVGSSMRLQLEKYNAQLSIDAQGDTTLRGDKLHLTSVIFNLLDNALKYSKANPSIRIEMKGDEKELELIMIDNGVGIAPEYREKIFEKFFRIPSGDTHNAKGYGLGLSYVAHVVHKHNGTIVVESQPGIGSRFILKFPKKA